jgi:hypothetical protein
MFSLIRDNCCVFGKTPVFRAGEKGKLHQLEIIVKKYMGQL